MDINKAKEIMGLNFIGPEELEKISSKLGIIDIKEIKDNIPEIPFNENELKKISDKYILILGIPYFNDKKKLTLNKLRSFLGYDPSISEPCFYNQDWYIKENFSKDNSLELKWYLIQKSIEETSRGKNPKEIIKEFNTKEKFPSAILTAFTFFSYYFLQEEILWNHDFIWCSDLDENGDRIYTGRYTDPKGINKKGFNIHRHLSIRPCYGSILEIT